MTCCKIWSGIVSYGLGADNYLPHCHGIQMIARGQVAAGISDPWGPFLEAPGNYRARSAALLSIPDRNFKSFENYTVKLSTKETKRTSLEVRTHSTFLEIFISKYGFGPVKLPGLSRNGPLGRNLGDHRHGTTLRRQVQRYRYWLFFFFFWLFVCFF